MPRAMGKGLGTVLTMEIIKLHFIFLTVIPKFWMGSSRPLFSIFVLLKLF